jgi:hypothetical protein
MDLMFDIFYMNEYTHECMKKSVLTNFGLIFHLGQLNEIWGKNELILEYP